MPEFDEIYRREFDPIKARHAFRHMNLYAGIERVREFDLASSVLLLKAGGTIHSLTRFATADRTNTDLSGTITVVTFASGRLLVSLDRPTEEIEDAPFYLGTRGGLNSRGLRVSSIAVEEFKYDQDAWIKKNQRAIDRALKRGANVVCLGEFDFPPLDIDGVQKTAVQSAAAIERHREWIRGRLKRHGKPVLVFAGSSHEWTDRGCANVGEVFIADDDGQGGVQVYRHHYRKRVAAGGLGEMLNQVTSPMLPYFGTSLGKVTVLICIDAFDPGVVMSLIASSRGIDRVGIILVPSYNPSERLVRSCQQLSYHANCTVVYVNAMPTAPHEKAQVFLSGIPLPTWQAQLTNVVKMVKRSVKPDYRVFDSIPGVRTPSRLVHLTEIGRDIKIQSLDGKELVKWVIPHGFAAGAATMLSEKYPFSRSRILASLASEED